MLRHDLLDTMAKETKDIKLSKSPVYLISD